MKFVFTMNLDDIVNIIVFAIILIVALIFGAILLWYEIKYRLRKRKEKKAKERGERLERKQ